MALTAGIGFWTAFIVFILCFVKLSETQEREGTYFAVHISPSTNQRLEQRCPRRCRCFVSVADCTQTNLQKIPLNFPPAIQLLNLDNNKIKVIPRRRLSQFPLLKTISLSGNKIDNRGILLKSFVGLKSVKRLDLSVNNLTRFPSYLPPSVAELNLNTNSISTVSRKAARSLRNVTTLSLGNNNLHDRGIGHMFFSSFQSLVNLDLSSNKLETIPLNLPASVGNLRVDNNRLEYFPDGIFVSSAEVHHLSLRGNLLTDTSFINPFVWENMTKLYFLDLSENLLRYVPGALPSSARQLSLELNSIEEISEWAFASVPKVTQIRLAFNNIRYIQPGAFSDLQYLQYLDLAHNFLVDVPNNLPRGLLSLFLESNKISSVQVDAFCPLYADTTFEKSKFQLIVLIGNPINKRSIWNSALYCLYSMDILVY